MDHPLTPADRAHLYDALQTDRALLVRAQDGHLDAVQAAESAALARLAHLPPPAVQIAVAEELARGQEARRALWLRHALHGRGVRLPDEHLPPAAPTPALLHDAADEPREHDKAAHAAVEPRILVAVDGSAPAMRAADLAARLAGPLCATVDLVSVVDLPQEGSGAAASMFRSGLHDAARQAGLVAARTRMPRGLVVHTRLLHGRIATVLLQEAAMAGVVLVVVGRRGRTDESALSQGSVSRTVSAHAHVPTLVVP